MAESIADLLAQHNFKEPPEVDAIKDFIRKKFQENAGVKIGENQIIITVASAALASVLRMELPKLAKEAKIDKKLIIRIG